MLRGSVPVPRSGQTAEDFRQKRMMGMTPTRLELLIVEPLSHPDRIPMEMKEVCTNLLDKMSETHNPHTHPFLAKPQHSDLAPACFSLDSADEQGNHTI
ncbi:rho guanine nucleotide exchange factor 1b isoform X1 [Lates japonicus]|uniref:Rho guanine nucleotide exchange factor 1b isoform X1 n=1 Tax=Lates japonicus TaxID=270547 RepID=A0AAD3NI23_LATJO|nr:rho guanine nucleotide exchange factor 1b isoform X1 [Lates japonicus]